MLRHLTLPQISEVGNDYEPGIVRTIFARTNINARAEKPLRNLPGEKLQYGILSSFPVADEIWLTGIYAPAEDFQGQIKAQYQKYLMQIIGIWILVGLLAIPLVFEATRPMMQIYEQATRDELTQLFNRTEILEQANKRIFKPS